MKQGRTSHPNPREVITGLAVITVLAGLSVTRWGIPQSGNAGFNDAKTTPMTQKEAEVKVVEQLPEEDSQSQSPTNADEDHSDPFGW